MRFLKSFGQAIALDEADFNVQGETSFDDVWHQSLWLTENLIEHAWLNSWDGVRVSDAYELAAEIGELRQFNCWHFDLFRDSSIANAMPRQSNEKVFRPITQEACSELGSEVSECTDCRIRLRERVPRFEPVDQIVVLWKIVKFETHNIFYLCSGQHRKGPDTGCPRSPCGLSDFANE
jgi:hypothetical protein